MNGLTTTTTGGNCSSKGIAPVFKTGAIYVQHVNCDGAIDWDDGKDRYQVTLKNGWVFKKVEYTDKRKVLEAKKSMLRITPRSKGTFLGPPPGNLKSAGKLVRDRISWSMSIGLTIEGPKGVPHY